MRYRSLRRVAVFVAIGLLTTVALAWTLALTQPVFDSPTFGTRLATRTMATRPRVPGAGEGEGWISVARFDAPAGWFGRGGAVFVESYIQPLEGEGSKPSPSEALATPSPESVLPRWESTALGAVLPRRPEGWPGEDENAAFMYDARGWPLPALSCTYTIEHDEKFKLFARAHGGIELAGMMRRKGGWSGLYPAALPVRPIWTGLIVNTLLFAAVLWALTAAMKATRGCRRKRHGLCGGCGYDLRGTRPELPCPECGRARS